MKRKSKMLKPIIEEVKENNVGTALLMADSIVGLYSTKALREVSESNRDVYTREEVKAIIEQMSADMSERIMFNYKNRRTEQ